MKRVFTASVCKEGAWYVAQPLRSSSEQGETVDGALANLREALALHFTARPNGRSRTSPRPPVRPLPYREVARRLADETGSGRLG